MTGIRMLWIIILMLMVRIWIGERERKREERDRDIWTLNEAKLTFYCTDLSRRVAFSKHHSKKGSTCDVQSEAWWVSNLPTVEQAKTWQRHEKQKQQNCFRCFYVKGFSHKTTSEWINKNVQWFLMTSGTFLSLCVGSSSVLSFTAHSGSDFSFFGSSTCCGDACTSNVTPHTAITI